AQVGSADAKNPATYNTALATFRQASDRAQQLINTDPEARLRKGEILFELANTLQLAGQSREAANTYNTILNEKLVPQRDPEVLLRQAAAQQRAGDYTASDQTCNRFRQTYPKDKRLADVLLQYAGNSSAQVVAAAKNASLPNRAQTLA